MRVASSEPSPELPAVAGPLPGILIYNPYLLPTVQHYVREHAVRMRRYRPVLAGRRRKPGTPVDDFPHFTFGANPLARAQELRFLIAGKSGQLTSFIRSHNIKLIHAHFGTGGTEIMKIAADLRLPLVTTFHGWDVKLGAEAEVSKSRYEHLYRSRLPHFFRQVARVVGVSKVWSERIVQLGCPPEKVMTNYLGVDTTFFDGARGDFDPLSILFVGRLIKRKGVADLIEAVHLLHSSGTPANLTVVGEGPELATLQTLAARFKVQVLFTGKKSPSEVRDLLRQVAVLCIPSNTVDGEVPEALGLISIEAQAMQVPVVGTLNGGIPETIQEGITGYLVAQSSSSSLAEALAKLLADQTLNRSFGEKARSFIRERFDIESSYRNLENLYDSLIDSSDSL